MENKESYFIYRVGVWQFHVLHSGAGIITKTTKKFFLNPVEEMIVRMMWENRVLSNPWDIGYAGNRGIRGAPVTIGELSLTMDTSGLGIYAKSEEALGKEDVLFMYEKKTKNSYSIGASESIRSRNDSFVVSLWVGENKCALTFGKSFAIGRVALKPKDYKREGLTLDAVVRLRKEMKEIGAVAAVGGGVFKADKERITLYRKGITP
jgi:hypothetical protein